MGFSLGHRFTVSLVVAVAGLLLPRWIAHAEEQDPGISGRLSIIEENDYFASHDDKDYTQGLRAAYLFPSEDPAWNTSHAWLSAFTPFFDGEDRRRKTEWIVLGQSLFTPTVTNSVSPSPRDRPYAAWLYTGMSFLQERQKQNHRRLENAELLLGVVGPLALGAITQNDFHQFIGVEPSRGWKNQIHNEPGVVLSYEWKWKLTQALGDQLAVEAIPEAGASLGNVFLYGQTSVTFRLGHNLEADYGPTHIRPGLSGTGWFDAEMLRDTFGWYVYAGAQGRVVGHNIFLDGNTVTRSPSVNKRLFVEDFVVGAALLWTDIRVDFSITERTKEFFGQTGSPNRFGGIAVSFGL